MNSKKLHDFDFYMVLTAGLLIAFGVVAIWSAQGAGQISILNEGVRQAVFAVIGAMLLIFVASFNYRFLGTLAWVFYAGTLAALVLVLVPGIGISIAGSRRWFDLGITTVQPSEFAKLATIIALSSFVASRGEQMRELGNFVVSLLIALVPAGLVFLEPDLGTASVFGIIWLAIILTTQARWRYLGTASRVRSFHLRISPGISSCTTIRKTGCSSLSIPSRIQPETATTSSRRAMPSAREGYLAPGCREARKAAWNC